MYLFFHLICHNVKIHRFGFCWLSKRDKMSNKSKHQAYCTDNREENRSTNYDKVVDLLTRDFHSGRKKKVSLNVQTRISSSQTIFSALS